MLRGFRLWGLFLRLLLFGYCLCNSYVVGDVTVTDDPYASERWNSATHSQGSGDFFQVLQEFSSHIIIRPEIRHASDKRLLSHTLNKENGLHLPLITLSYHHNGQRVSIDLKLHDGLLPDEHFLRYQNSQLPKGQVVQNFTKTELDLCHYQGCIRGNSDSIVAVSTCHGGVNGIVFDGIATHFIQSVRDGRLQDDHFLFRHSDSLNKKHTCGYDGNVDNHHNSRFHIPNNYQFNRILRYKRSYDDDSNVIRGPYNANRHSLYVELVIVVDNGVYKSFGENRKKVHQYCKDLVNIVNALYVPLNIFVTLQGVVIWNESNEISISSSSSHTLYNFLKYRHNKLSLEHPNDNAQLLTKQHFTDYTSGIAYLDSICSTYFSGAVVRKYSKSNALVAATMAHEMGHNFGMHHDSSDCKCQDKNCIMYGSSAIKVHWSSCSIEQFSISFSSGNTSCLRNKPTQLFESPQCGNGFVEPGEQCDCGPPNYCVDTCCDPFTCMWHSNTYCTIGKCCDRKTCQMKTAGTVCRDAKNECDLPEYCTGESEYCPADVFLRDTEMCDNGRAFCYQGNCTATCGSQQICVNHKCMTVTEVRSTGLGRDCPENCNGNGLCNSRGNCHCNIGFNRPTCLLPGPGGSVDSGPATNPNITVALKSLMYIFLLSVLPVWTGCCLYTHCCRKEEFHIGDTSAKNITPVLSFSPTTNIETATTVIPNSILSPMTIGIM